MLSACGPKLGSDCGRRGRRGSRCSRPAADIARARARARARAMSGDCRSPRRQELTGGQASAGTSTSTSTSTARAQIAAAPSTSPRRVGAGINTKRGRQGACAARRVGANELTSDKRCHKRCQRCRTRVNCRLAATLKSVCVCMCLYVPVYPLRTCPLTWCPKPHARCVSLYWSRHTRCVWV